MDFDWTDEERTFREELRACIYENVRPGWHHENRDMTTQDDVDSVLKFCQAMGAKGFLTPHWPTQYGGRDASPWEQAIISEETWAARST
jgi:alkylation response protein AidB-like acyl-CoA dehydrogenase